VTVVDDFGNGSQSFSWCVQCEHSGRVALVRSKRGYWAVAHAQVTAFVRGQIDEHAGVTYLGPEPPAGHRYENAGSRIKE
jgi:hypothetical protein